MSVKTDWIKSQLLPNEKASEASSRLNTPLEIDNPVAQAQIDVPITLSAIRKLVAPAEAFKVMETQTWDDIVTAININDRQAIKELVAVLVGGGAISMSTVVNLQGLLTAKTPDPNWRAKILTTPAKLAGFDFILVDEVESCL